MQAASLGSWEEERGGLPTASEEAACRLPGPSPLPAQLGAGVSPLPLQWVQTSCGLKVAGLIDDLEWSRIRGFIVVVFKLHLFTE